MKDEFIIYTGDILSVLTKYVKTATNSIEHTKRLFDKHKIVLEENVAKDFCDAIAKLFAQINSLEREDNNRSS